MNTATLDLRRKAFLAVGAGCLAAALAYKGSLAAALGVACLGALLLFQLHRSERVPPFSVLSIVARAALAPRVGVVLLRCGASEVLVAYGEGAVAIHPFNAAKAASAPAARGEVP